MFRQLVFNSLPSNPTPENKEAAAEALLRSHPFQIASLLEDVWNRRLGANPPTTTDLGSPGNRSVLAGFPGRLPFPAPSPRVPPRSSPDPNADAFRWDHLIYAYMIENTRLYEIFRRVLQELLHGEKLGTPIAVNVAAECVSWLRTTEELFYANSAPFRIVNIVSHVRSDLRATRRNAYQRLLGMDLNHGSDDGKPYSYIKAEAANSDFVSTFEEFLREVWVGITYVTATSSSNPTDNSKISELANKLFDMLLSRRQNGNLAREEFDAVSMMSWFHLTLEYNSSIVKSLRAEATGVDQRLFKIAQQVGLPAHGLSRSFFDIADHVSRVLIEIETGVFNDQSTVRALYTPPSELEEAMRTIITHWTAITGRDVKARKVATS